MKKIEFGEVRVGETARRHILECLDKNQITGGVKVRQYEREFAKLFGYNFATMTSSGTTADMAALMALYDFGAKPGDEIIVPALCFCAVWNAVIAAGFKPVPVDVGYDLNINPKLAERAITPKTRAILCVNTMGKPCHMSWLSSICENAKIVLICDNCEGHGCLFDGQPMSHYATMVTYSSYAAHLTFTGEGGCVCTNSSVLDEILKSIRSHGRKPNDLYFDHLRFGLNFKNTDLHASLGLESVEEFPETFKIRKHNWYYLTSKLSKLREDFYFSEEDKGDVNAPHGLSFTANDMNESKASENIYKLKQAFEEHQIHWKRNFGSINQHKAFIPYYGDFPIADHCGDYGIHIGCHRYLSQEDLDRIVKAGLSIYD